MKLKELIKELNNKLAMDPEANILIQTYSEDIGYSEDEKITISHNALNELILY